MQRSSQAALLLVLFALAGCNRSSNAVFVDLDQILKQEQAVAPAPAAPPKPPSTRPFLVETVPGAPAVSIPDPANAPRQNVQDMFKAEQAKAFAELQRRLRQFYNGEIQSFRLQQEQSIGGEEQAAYEKANERIRPLFDAWAVRRAPTFARLAIIAGFPDPNPTSKPTDKSVAPLIQRRLDEAKQLRLELKKIDAQFQADSKALLADLLAKSAADQEALRAKIEAFADSLDKRAEDEARSQIREAASQLIFKLAEPTPIAMDATPTRHVSIPAEKALDPAPEVPSGGILDTTADRRRLLEHELRIWLALNRYTLAGQQKGYRNVTQEFQTWRQQHGAGP